jgi:hypothetical protein
MERESFSVSLRFTRQRTLRLSTYHEMGCENDTAILPVLANHWEEEQ